MSDITLNAATNLTGINGLIVPEGTVLNMTAAQFQQLGIGNGVSGIITGVTSGGRTTLSAKGNATRAQVAVMLHRFLTF